MFYTNTAHLLILTSNAIAEANRRRVENEQREREIKMRMKLTAKTVRSSGIFLHAVNRLYNKSLFVLNSFFGCHRWQIRKLSCTQNALSISLAAHTSKKETIAHDLRGKQFNEKKRRIKSDYLHSSSCRVVNQFGN